MGHRHNVWDDLIIFPIGHASSFIFYLGTTYMTKCTNVQYKTQPIFMYVCTHLTHYTQIRTTWQAPACPAQWRLASAPPQGWASELHVNALNVNPVCLASGDHLSVSLTLWLSTLLQWSTCCMNVCSFWHQGAGRLSPIPGTTQKLLWTCSCEQACSLSSPRWQWEKALFKVLGTEPPTGQPQSLLSCCYHSKHFKFRHSTESPSALNYVVFKSGIWHKKKHKRMWSCPEAGTGAAQSSDRLPWVGYERKNSSNIYFLSQDTK